MCGYFCIGFIDFMLAGKKLTDFTSLFSPYDFDENENIILSYLKMDKTKLSDHKKVRLDEIEKIENYFNSEINQRKWCSKKLSKYVTTFDYIDKILIVLNARTVGAPVGIASAGFTVVFSLATGKIKKLLKTTKNKRKSMIKFLC